MQLKRKYKLTATCSLCGYKITNEIVSDLADLTEAKNQFAKEVSGIHKQHPGPDNFEVTDKLL
jgi:hypothetical protein